MDSPWSTEKTDFFSQSVAWSVLAHGVLILVGIVRLAFFPSENLVLQSAVRVDLVALPDKILEPPQELDSQPAPAELPKREEVAPSAKKISEEKSAVQLKKDSRQKALRKLKALEALEKLEKEEQSQRPKTVFKGNQVSPGTELRGIVRLEHEDYVGQIERHVKSKWFRPEWMRSQNLNARVLIKFDASGNILQVQLSKSSGNAAFDELATETVQKSNPLPRPPEKFRDLFQIQGVVLIFGENN